MKVVLSQLRDQVAGWFGVLPELRNASIRYCGIVNEASDYCSPQE